MCRGSAPGTRGCSRRLFRMRMRRPSMNRSEMKWSDQRSFGHCGRASRLACRAPACDRHGDARAPSRRCTAAGCGGICAATETSAPAPAVFMTLKSVVRKLTR
jgi:hypothetical protein